jgi:hypothetical protein
VDDTFSALDGDSDGKVTKSELTEAMTRLSDQLNAQFDAARVGRGGPPPDGAPPAGQDGGDASSTTGATDTDATTGTNGMAGMGGPGGAGGPHGPRGGGGGDGDSGDSTDATSSTSTDYVAAADTDGDGTVSDAEQAAYDKKQASEKTDGSSSSSSAHQKDPMRELAHALHLLKAYAENSGSSDSTTASTSDNSTASTSSVSVEA